MDCVPAVAPAPARGGGFTLSLTRAANRIIDSAVVALAMHNGDAPLNSLLDMARDNQSPKVRTTALLWLGQSKDSRVLKFFAKK